MKFTKVLSTFIILISTQTACTRNAPLKAAYAANTDPSESGSGGGMGSGTGSDYANGPRGDNRPPTHQKRKPANSEVNANSANTAEQSADTKSSDNDLTRAPQNHTVPSSMLKQE